MRLRPHFSNLSTVAPFSAMECSMVVMSLSMSVSGVSGRTIKIRSYRLSSIAPRSFLSRNLVRWCGAPIKARHRRAGALRQNNFDRLGRRNDHVVSRLALTGIDRAQNVVGQIAELVFRLHAQAHPQEIGGADRADDRLHAVVPAGAAVF